MPEPDAFDYLGGPYFHERDEVRAGRYRALTIIAAKLAHNGATVFSPITHSHPLQQELGGRFGDLEFWMAFDGAFMRAAKALIVVKLPGWERSRGLRRELEYFADARKPIIEFQAPQAVLPGDLWSLLLEGQS